MALVRRVVTMRKFQVTENSVSVPLVHQETASSYRETVLVKHVPINRREHLQKIKQSVKQLFVKKMNTARVMVTVSRNHNVQRHS